MNAIRTLLVISMLVVALPGCIPLMVGGFIGYKMAESHEHDLWCSQHIDDPSCHP